MNSKGFITDQHPFLGDCYQLRSRTGEASATIFRYGAQVTSYRQTSDRQTSDPKTSHPKTSSGAAIDSSDITTPTELLFVSEKATFTPGLAIRGGIPLCFPQFADRGDLPFHGFARTATGWEVSPEESSQSKVTLKLNHAPDSVRDVWPHRFELSYTVEINDQDLLETTVKVVNKNSSTPFCFTIALHTYFSVSEISKVCIHGLQGLEYLDKTQAGAKARQEAERLTFEGEVNRIYLNTDNELFIHDGSRRVSLIKSSSLPDAVVWNPGQLSGASFKDLGPEEYRKFACLEAGAIKTPVTLLAGQSWQGSQVVGCRS